MRVYVHCNPITHFDALGLSDIYIDGTLNVPDDGTNVRDMFEATDQGENDNVHYYEGPKEWADGGDTKSIVQSAYDQIAKNWAEGDKEINIVGFSRGGAAANELAWMINDKGIVGADGTVHAKPGEAQVGFLGMFDPVHSMGKGQSNHGWHDKTIAPNVNNAAIAYAKDESRTHFTPSKFQRSEGARTTITTAWFPGYHSDVGGHKDGNPNIKQITQMFMGAAADHAGMNVHPDYAATVDNLRTSEGFYQRGVEPKLKGHPKFQAPNPGYLLKAIPFNDTFKNQKPFLHSERKR